jgi:hypothetical protein
MNYEGNDWGYFGFVHVVGLIAYGVFALLALAVVTGLVILLVRFLLIGTKAAQLYVAKNSPAKTASPVTGPATSGSTEPASRPTPPTTTPTGSTEAPSPVDAAIGRAPSSDRSTDTSSTTTQLPTSVPVAPKNVAKKPATPRTPKTPPTV